MSKWSEWYHRNKEVQWKRIYTNRKARNIRLRKIVTDTKEAGKCVRCGYDNPIALHFHHRDPSTKSFNIGNLIETGLGEKRLAQEINKCDLLCANCHLIHHHEK